VQLVAVDDGKEEKICSFLLAHAKSRFVSLFVHLWKHTVFLLQVREERIR
jgi:hypothetical protein